MDWAMLWAKIHGLTKRVDSGEVGIPVIDFDAWGITNNIYALYAAGGGSAHLSIAHDDFWRSIPKNNRFVCKVNLGADMTFSVTNSNYRADGMPDFFVAQGYSPTTKVTTIFSGSYDNNGEFIGTELTLLLEDVVT